MPLTSLLDNEFEVMMQIPGMTPSEQHKLPYWKFEIFIDKLNKKNEEESARYKKQHEEQASSAPSMSGMNPSSLMSKAAAMMR